MNDDHRIEHQAQAIAVLVGHMRPDWQHPGVIAAIRNAMQHGSDYDRPFPDVALACVKAAADRRNRTPAVLGMPGEHWQTRSGDGGNRPPRGDEACDRHPHCFRGHPNCAEMDAYGDEPVDVIDLEQQGLHGRDLALAVRQQLWPKGEDA